MTEYWVSQGNKWCDFCKIFISNNPTSIRNHELGQRHKESVAKRLNTMREEKAAKDKEAKDAARALEQIEAKAKRSYQKDITTSQALPPQEDAQDWEYNSTSGYYYNQSNGCYYDPNSGFYYTDALGKWVTREEALASCKNQPKPISKKSSFTTGNKNGDNPSPGHVVSPSLNPIRMAKGSAPSSIAVNKRKKPDSKPKAVSEEERAALKAREAARKRVEEREKPLLGLYRH